MKSSGKWLGIWLWLFVLTFLVGCADIPSEVPLILEAKAKAEERMEADYQRLLEDSVGERARLQSLLLEGELRNRWIAASPDGRSIPLAALPDIEQWARTERAKHEAEKQTAITNYGNSESIQQQRRLTAALREWMKTRVDTAELINLQRILEAIQGRPPPGGAASDGPTPTPGGNAP